jgi:NTE family protein
MLFLFAFASTKVIAQNKPKVAFVLSGGGARGFAHVGVLKVLEEVGFKPDIITGTSMGSVVGGLYAIGYRSDTLKQIVLSTDWNDVVYDRVSRTTLNALERDRFDRYVLRLGFEGTRFVATSGFVKGTKVHNMLSRLCLPVADVKDFKKLPIPFECVATDIQTGRKVVLDKGSLPDAIRASMAIPSLFTSMEIDGKVLVDGGLTQNYPIIEAKNLGADYIIGIDVGTKSTKEELNSFVNVMMESMFLHGYQNFDKEKQYLNINIKPDLAQFSPLDFEEGDSIIKIGEAAARAQIDELRALYTLIYGNKAVPTNVKSDQAKLNPIFYIKEVEMQGLESVSKIQLKSILDELKNKKLSASEIDLVMHQLENTNLFTSLLYQFDDSDGKGKLIIQVNEKTRGDVGVGINFNTIHEASLLLGFTYRRCLLKGATLAGDFRLSSMPRGDLSYYYQSRYRPAFGIEASFNNIEQGLYTDNKKISTVYSVYSSLYAKLKYNLSNLSNFGIGVGVEQNINSADAVISLDQIVSIKINKHANALMVFYRQDSRDDSYIPTSGGRTSVDIFWVNNDFDLDKAWFNGTLKSERHVKLSPRVHVSNYFNLGLNDTRFQPGNLQFAYSMGGMLDMRFRNYFAFGGLNFAQVFTRNMAHYRLKPSYKLFKNNFVSLIGEVSSYGTYAEDMIQLKDVMFAYGASYEYRSPIGPLQFNVSRSDKLNKFIFYMNIGYWF